MLNNVIYKYNKCNYIIYKWLNITLRLSYIYIIYKYLFLF